MLPTVQCSAQCNAVHSAIYCIVQYSAQCNALHCTMYTVQCSAIQSVEKYVLECNEIIRSAVQGSNVLQLIAEQCTLSTLREVILKKKLLPFGHCPKVANLSCQTTTVEKYREMDDLPCHTTIVQQYREVADLLGAVH